MKTKLRYKIGAKIIAKIAHKRKRKLGIPNYPVSKNLLFILDENILSNSTLIDAFERKLISEGKEIHRLVFFNKTKNIPAEKLDNTTFISRKDLTLWGSPKTKQCKKIINTSYDFAINLDMNGEESLNSLISLSKAVCRVGYFRSNKSVRCYDLSIGLQEKTYTFPNFLTDIDTYLHRIQ